jgi:HD superfamily phosphohydrolase
MGQTRRIRTILYDDQQVEATELELLHTPALQRLYDLHQLGLTDRVYVDASHSRLHHVVGVLQQVDYLVGAVVQNLQAHSDRTLRFHHDGRIDSVSAAELAERVTQRRPAVRLMGLLHDLTHSPFGHTLEDEIRLITSKHDEPARQAKAFYRLLCQYICWVAHDSGTDEALRGSWGSTSRKVAPNEEAKTRLARYLDAPDLLAPPEDPESIKLLAGLAAAQLKKDTSTRHATREPQAADLRRFFHDLHFAMRGLLYLDCLHKDKHRLSPEQIPDKRDDSYSFEKLIQTTLELVGSSISSEERFLPQRDAFYLDIIGNTICADLLDYAKRDSHFANLKLAYDEKRIVENFTLISHKEESDYFQGPSIRTAISMFSHKLRLDVPGELLNLLHVRFYLSQRVLFHPTKCIAGGMLGAALQLIGWKVLPDHLAFVGDAVFLYQVSEAARTVRDMLKEATHDTELDVEFIAALNQRLDSIPINGITLAAKKLLEDRTGQLVSRIQGELRGAIRLLDRLASRRYYKPIFRILPGIDVDGRNIDEVDIAKLFQDPEVRMRAERTIETEACLPSGAVVIHCPDSKGPQKIAAMLIVMEDKNKACRLREIARLRPKLLQKHGDAIQALEEMYASTWRLVVAVAPRFRGKYEDINKHVARILYKEIMREVLGDDAKGELPNDPLMIQELKQAVGAIGSVTTSDDRDLEPGIVEASTDQQKRIAQPALTDSSKKPTLLFDEWFVRIVNEQPRGKTKSQLRAAKKKLKSMIDPLPLGTRQRFFIGFEKILINQAKTMANLIKGSDGEEIVRAASALLKTIEEDRSDSDARSSLGLFPETDEEIS